MTYTLVTDGSSDRVLLPILTWSLKNYTNEPIVQHWADFSRIPRQQKVEARLRVALDLYPCDLLFVHRDAEGQPPEKRRREISAALINTYVFHIPVVPVRMTEAWLLVDELSIRFAAGNPNGKEELDLPEIGKLEDIPDPKTVLYDALSRASGRNARRRSTFPVHQRVHLIPNYIGDFSLLERLPSFQVLQRDIKSGLKR